MCSIDDVQGVVILLVVLRPKRFCDELQVSEQERDFEVGRDELGHEPILRRWLR